MIFFTSSLPKIRAHFQNLALLYASEDYRVTAAGNYKWMEDEEGILRPVTRLKNKIMERK